jgi:N-acetylglutamate synthase-like GNAT family acetyltransferase
MLIQGKFLSFGNDLSDVYMIRRKVFVEELNGLQEIELDDQDDMSMNVIVYEEVGNMRPVATGRIIFDGTSCMIDQIAVLKEFRNKRYGDFTVRMLLNKAFTSGIHNVECITPAEIKEFFESIGFHTTDIEIMVNSQKCYKMLINESDIMTACNKCI